LEDGCVVEDIVRVDVRVAVGERVSRREVKRRWRVEGGMVAILMGEVIQVVLQLGTR
jgi:hypothetical protein